MDLGVAAEGRRLGHKGPPRRMGWRPILQRRTCPVDPAGGIASRGMYSALRVKPFSADVKSETMAITDPGNPGNIGKK
jgi:hypothetical protein